MIIGMVVVIGPSTASRLLQQCLSFYLVALFITIFAVAIDASPSDRNYNRRNKFSSNSKPHIDEISRGHRQSVEEYSMYDVEFTVYEDDEEDDGAKIEIDEDEWQTMRDWEANTEHAYDDNSAAEEERILMALERVTQGRSHGETRKKSMDDPSFATHQRPSRPNVSSRNNIKSPVLNYRTTGTAGQKKKASLPKRGPSNRIRSPSNSMFRRSDEDTDKSNDIATSRKNQENQYREQDGKRSSVIAPEGNPQQFHEHYAGNQNSISYRNSGTFVAPGLPQGGPWPTAPVVPTSIADGSIPTLQSQSARHNTSPNGMQSAVAGQAAQQFPHDPPQFGSSSVANSQSISAATAATKTAPANAASTTPWIRQFLATRPKDVLLPIPLDYLSDGFNLVQLAPIVERIGLETLARAGEDPVEVAKRLQQLQHQIGGGTATSSKAYLHPIYKTALKLILRAEREEATLTPSTATMSEMTQKSNQEKADMPREATLAYTAQVQQQQHNIHSPNQQIQHVTLDEDPLLALIPAPALQRAAEALYLMVHSRFVTSPRGLESIRRIIMTSSKSSSKTQDQQFQHHAVFGRCPRISCRGMPLLPYGDQNDYHSLSASSTQPTNKQLQRYNYFQHRCKRYCCSCGEVSYCWDSKTDGCAWGPSFCHLFLLAHGQQVFPQVVVERLQQEQQKRQKTSKQAVSSVTRDSASSTSDNSSFDARDTGATGPASSNQCRRQVYGFDIHPGTPWGHPPR